MNAERVDAIRRRHSLMPLVEHTTLIRERHGRVYIPDKLPAPVDEFGIPRPAIMMQMLLGQMATQNYIWTGVIDEHHMATPKADYTVMKSGIDPVGSRYRGQPMLKVKLARQTHNLAHAGFELPRKPSADLAHQVIQEADQLRTVWAVLMTFGDEYQYGNEEIDALCLDAARETIGSQPDGQVNIFPDRGELLVMELAEMRYVVGCLLQVQRMPAKHLIHRAIRHRRPLAA